MTIKTFKMASTQHSVPNIPVPCLISILRSPCPQQSRTQSSQSPPGIGPTCHQMFSAERWLGVCALDILLAYLKHVLAQIPGEELVGTMVSPLFHATLITVCALYARRSILLNIKTLGSCSHFLFWVPLIRYFIFFCHNIWPQNTLMTTPFAFSYKSPVLCA